MGHQSHGHGDVDAILGGESGYLPSPILGNSPFQGKGGAFGHKDKHGKKEKGSKGSKQKRLTFHCVTRRKTDARQEYKQSVMDFPLPIRCYTCNLPIAGKWKSYVKKVASGRTEDGRSETGELVYLTSTTKITAEGRAMNDLGLTRECCRRHFLTHPGQ